MALINRANRLQLTVACRLGLLLAVALILATSFTTSHGQIAIGNELAIDFNRDIRPILSDNCFRCHGPDESERATDLRLDQKQQAFAKLESGGSAIRPKDVAASELIRRINSSDPDTVMPPPATGKSLSVSQKVMMGRWIEQGANWSEHWSFIAPIRPPLVNVQRRLWPINPIDYFVLKRLEDENLTPAPEANRETLVRRVTFDLTGLPPTPEEVQEFVNDGSANAYERLVDRLLQSPRFGEHMARHWLDAARYGDTHGLHLDNERSIWPYRDWVIASFNENMPFDQFTVEQLAGDLLANPTDRQLVATGFNRCNVTTSEGGSINEEYLVRYAVDRVETTSTVWLGLTTGCAVCHDHKFDPISQKEFYQLFAYFFSLTEKAMDGNALLPPPVLKVPTTQQSRRQRQLEVTSIQLQEQISLRRNQSEHEFQTWLESASKTQDRPSIPLDHVFYAALNEMDGDKTKLEIAGKNNVTDASIVGAATWDAGKQGNALYFDGKTHIDCGDVANFERSDAFSYGGWVYRKNDDHMTIVSRMDDSANFRGFDLYLAEGKVFVHLISNWPGNAIRLNTKQPIGRGKWQHVWMTYDGSSQGSGVRIYVDGQRQDVELTVDKLSGSIKTDKHFRIGRRTDAAPFQGLLDGVRVYARELSSDEVLSLAGVDPVAEILAVPTDQRSDSQVETLFEHYLNEHDSTYRKLHRQLDAVHDRIRKLKGEFASTLVMRERDELRTAHILKRGEYDQKGEAVMRGVPSILPAIKTESPTNRLDLARWLVSPEHPLTARVTVNRMWQRLFGVGLVKTTEDFGSQGEWPSHPQLFDWLATEFMRSGWNVKHMYRLMVSSATYRQTSAASPTRFANDPENRLLSRGPRFRLDAEIIRDNALAVSGLLVEEQGGRSVRPYQPDGLWVAVGYTTSNTARFKKDEGAKLYRRSMYTFWKRTSPPPTMQIFDAPSREVCTVRRARTNTPAGALALMNDPQFVEAARFFAERILREGGTDSTSRIQFGFRWATSRAANENEIRVLQDLLDDYLKEYRADVNAAIELLSVGDGARDESIDVAEHAAWTMLASALLNLDEAISKQ